MLGSLQKDCSLCCCRVSLVYWREAFPVYLYEASLVYWFEESSVCWLGEFSGCRLMFLVS